MILATLLRAWRVGSEATHAIQAAEEELTAGGSYFAALRAFAAATDGQLDDAAVAELEQALRQVITWLERASTGAAWLYEHQNATTDLLNAVLNAGYRAAGLRAKLAALLD